MKNNSRALPLFLTLLCLLGAGLRFLQISGKSLWLDEETSLAVARHGFGEICSGRLFDNHTPPFYYALLHCWLWFSSDSEFGIRSLSAAIDSLNIGLCYWAFLPLLGALPSLIIACLYAFSSYAIYFAQEARMYPLLLCLCLLFQGNIFRMAFEQEKRSGARTFLLGILAALGLYTHYYFAPFALAAGSILLLRNRKDRGFVIPLFLAAGLATLCFLPWIPKVLALANSGGQNFRQFLFTVIPYAFFRYAAGYGNLPIELQMKLHMRETVVHNIPLLLCYLLVPGILILSILRTGLTEFREKFLILLWMFLIPPLLMLLLSLRSPMFSERYLIIVFPHFLALLALSLRPFQETQGSTKSKNFLKLIRTTLLGLFLFALYQHYGNPRFGFADWRSVAAKIAVEGFQETRAVVVKPGYSKGVLSYYLKGSIPILGYEDDKNKLREALANLEGTEERKDLFFVETASQDSAVAVFERDGFQKLSEEVFPFENGLRVTRFHFPEPVRAELPPIAPQPPILAPVETTTVAPRANAAQPPPPPSQEIPESDPDTLDD